MPFKKLTARRKTSNKYVSRGRTHKENHVKTRTLDSMLMPKFKQRFDGNGINTAIWHTGKDLDSGKFLTLSGGTGNATSTGNQQIVKGGDWDMFSCLPGRQCYMEFQCLPMFNPNDMDTPDSVEKSKTYLGFEMTFGRLVNEAFKNNQAYMLTNSTLSSGSAETPGFSELYDLFLNGYYNFYDSSVGTFRSKTFDKMMNTVVHYQGGKQVHKFMNTTGLPVYMEFREFTPRDFLPYSYHNMDSLTSPAAAASVYAFPGLYETITEDRAYQAAYYKLSYGGSDPTAAGQVGQDTTNTGTGGPNDIWDYRAGFNQLDDKDFKYKGNMPLTNMRFKVGEAKRVRVDPGETFTYELVLPPYSCTLKKMFYTMYLSMTHVAGAAILDKKKFGNRPYGFALHPKLSKGLQVRVTGSTAFAATDSGKKLGQFNSYADAGVNFGLDHSATTDTPNANIKGLKAVATHAVQMTHTMSEYHEVRVIPWYRSSNYVRYNTLANCYNANDLTLADDMRAVNPETNNVDEVDGDGDDVMA